MGRRIAVAFFLLAVVCALAFKGYRAAPITQTTQAKPAGRLVGNVSDGKTGAALPAEVAVSNAAGRQITLRHAVSSPGGEYASEGLPAGAYHLTTKLDGYAPEHASVVLDEGETLRVDFRLKKTKLVRGAVQGPSGAPLVWADVRLIYRADADGPGGFAATYQWETGDVKTDSQGRYVVAAHPDKEFVVEALHPDLTGAVSAPARIKPGQSEAVINLKLGRAVGVSGEVKDARGNPVEGARVVLRDLGGSPASPQFAASEVLSRMSKVAFSDEAGGFDFKQVRPTRQMLVVVHPSYKVFRQMLNPANGRGPTALSITLADKR